MIHDIDSVEEELGRSYDRPNIESAPPVLSMFEVDTAVPAMEYVKRLRELMHAALTLGVNEDFTDEDLPTEDIPEWFHLVSSEQENQAPMFARTGRASYKALYEGETWELQWWLYRFAPDEDSRGWEWWDITTHGEHQVRVWVDSWGEAFFGCDELRWAILTAGATRVEGPQTARAATWASDAGLA